MKIFEVTQDEQEEDRRRKPNPLNGGIVDDSAWDAFDDFDDELAAIVSELKHQHPGLKHSDYHKMSIDAVIDTVRPTVIPIDQLTSTEPGYNAEHVATIDLNGHSLPIVYQINGLNVIADGNHRVIAAHLSGKKQVKVNLITVDNVVAVAKQMHAARTNNKE